ncbi:hypothetical protein N0V85_003019 [Neurospora sp. IMI 360204]|nr:hypothetical protein N0V85_003019 [Neurospora sp. IMI 360204]
MPPLPPCLPSKPSNSASQASHSALKSPVMKREPGMKESPPHHAQANQWRESTTRRRRASPPLPYPIHPRQRKKTEREKATGSEVWQYLVSLRSDLYMAKSVAKVKSMRDLLALPRKRDLPEIWKTRLALEGAAPGNLRLLVAYLVVGDEPQVGSIMCNSKGSNCAKEWQTVGPAMAAFDEGKNFIYKAAAFPICILFPEHGTSSIASRERQCVNAHYWESKAESMPPIWSPPASTAAPAPPPILPRAFSPPPAQSYFPAPAQSYSPAPAESYSPTYSPPLASTPFNGGQRALPTTLHPETPMRHSIQDAPVQQETGSLASTWEQRNEPLYHYGPGNSTVEGASPGNLRLLVAYIPRWRVFWFRG